VSSSVLLELNCPAIVMPIKGGASSPFVPSGSLLEEIHVTNDPGSKSTNMFLLDSCSWMAFVNAKLIGMKSSLSFFSLLLLVNMSSHPVRCSTCSVNLQSFVVIQVVVLQPVLLLLAGFPAVPLGFGVHITLQPGFFFVSMFFGLL
jgi:hypothetical protein